MIMLFEEVIKYRHEDKMFEENARFSMVREYFTAFTYECAKHK